MLQKLVFWCEFPKTVDWKKADDLFKDLNCEVYVAVNSVEEYKKWKKKTKLNVSPWPVLSKKEGYWFSGFTSKKGIDKLKQYKGLGIKIDLEPPLPEGEWGNFKMLLFAVKMIFKKGENNEYLEEEIYNLALEQEKKGVEILINEFPFPLWYLRRQGIHLELHKNMKRNYMGYSSFAGGFFRPFARMYLKRFMRKEVRKNPDISFSVGLIGTGILKTEGVYKNVDEFKQDLKLVVDSGCRNVAVYSLDSILKRDNPEEWIKAVRSFT